MPKPNDTQARGSARIDQKVRPPLTCGPVVDKVSGRLLASECAHCGQIVFPSVTSCPACSGEDLKVRELSERGRLYTYTVLHLGARGWKAPYALGYIDMPEGVRVFGHLRPSESQWTVGAQVRVRLADPLLNADGNEVAQYYFEEDSDAKR